MNPADTARRANPGFQVGHASTRTPMQQMIDRACGLPDGWQNDPKYAPKKIDEDALGAAMVAVCDLAVKWQKHGRRYEMRLTAAVSKLKSIGY